MKSRKIEEQIDSCLPGECVCAGPLLYVPEADRGVEAGGGQHQREVRVVRPRA